jgi:hypothetical protein
MTAAGDEVATPFEWQAVVQTANIPLVIVRVRAGGDGGPNGRPLSLQVDRQRQVAGRSIRKIKNRRRRTSYITRSRGSAPDWLSAIGSFNLLSIQGVVYLPIIAALIGIWTIGGWDYGTVLRALDNNRKALVDVGCSSLLAPVTLCSFSSVLASFSTGRVSQVGAITAVVGLSLFRRSRCDPARTTHRSSLPRAARAPSARTRTLGLSGRCMRRPWDDRSSGLGRRRDRGDASIGGGLYP